MKKIRSLLISSIKNNYKPILIKPIEIKPIEPLSDACCGNDCQNCIWTEYFVNVEKYEALLSQKEKEKE